jgi:hypothetical protein
MPPTSPLPTILLLLAAAVSLAPAGWAQRSQYIDDIEGEHPRLFITPQRIEALREAVDEADSFHARVFEVIKQRVDGDDWHAYEGPANIARAAMAREAAMVYQITDDRRYAELAYRTLMAIARNPRGRGRIDSGNGLNRAAVGLGFAITYDWCYPGWTNEQRRAVREHLIAGLEAWPGYGHSNFGGEMVSHWVPICRGAELIMILAAYEDVYLPDRCELLTTWLNRHITNAYGPTGINQEGVGVVAEAAMVLIPAALAMRDVGDDGLETAFNSRQWWRLAMYTGTSSLDADGRRRYLPSGISAGTLRPIGFASLLLPTVPTEHRGHYNHFYARHVGLRSQGTDDQRFDDGQAGAVWALLYRPQTLEEADPQQRMPRAFVDRRRGVMMARNQWADENDVLVTITADAANQAHAWNQAEALSIGLVGFDNTFIGGPGKQAASRYFSTLLVDGKHHGNVPANKTTGTVESMDVTDSGGYAIVGGGEQYKSLGIDSVERHLLVDFTHAKNAALIGVLDRIQSAKQHDYAWQLNIGDEVSDTALKLSRGNEEGRTTFTLTGQNGGFLKAWVMTPAEVKLQLDDPLQVITRNTIVDVWVVMLIGQGEAPTAKIQGQGLDASITLNGATMRYDRKAGRMVAR